MKCMERNKVRFYYAQYEGREPILNAQSRPSGQYKVIYGDPVECYGNLSAAMGETQTRQFGEDESYDKVLVADTENPINEYSILWVDTMPELNGDGSLVVDARGEVITSHDYVVKKVAKSLNSVSIAISKVMVNG